MPSLEPRILAVGTALPEFRFEQADVRALIKGLFNDGFRDFDRLLAVFDNGHVKARYLSAPLEWFKTNHTWTERNEIYIRTATDLGERAARIALERSGVKAQDVGAIFFVSTTGLATPSLDSFLIKRLNLSRHIARIPIWGLGCAGGAAGLNRASEFVRATGKPALLVAVELSSLTFQANDVSRPNLIATSLFADGAAAVVIAPDDSGSGPGQSGPGQSGPGQSGPSIIGGSSTLWDDTEDVMGWVVTNTGLQVTLSKSVPNVVEKHIRQDVEMACANHGLRFEHLKHFVTHPGGEKVMEAFQTALGLPAEALDDAREILEHHGNMSSPTVLFALERFLQRWPELPTGEHGLLTAMGPGFSAEHLIFRT
jgi:alkylresorcinol/alkylpyrone synthase